MTIVIRTLAEVPHKIADPVILRDHLGGFDQDLMNPVLQALDQRAADMNKVLEVGHHSIYSNQVQKLYPALKFSYDFGPDSETMWYALENYGEHPEATFETFLCSFNGAPHVSRKLLVSLLQRFGWFNPDTCSKNFAHDPDTIDGHLEDYVGDRARLYRKFFVGDDHGFAGSVSTFGYVPIQDHSSNIDNLDHRISRCFLHLISESMATSYYPFVTEKFLYSVVTRGLFLAYAQPGWHQHLEQHYGFRPFRRIFDYRFDSVLNPVDRLLELASMLCKFEKLSQSDWRDLYEMEVDTLEFNHYHYFSKSYLKHIYQHLPQAYSVRDD